MTRAQADIKIQKLQSELARLREEENVLQQVINLVKSQLSAVQVPGQFIIFSTDRILNFSLGSNSSSHQVLV